MIDANVNEKDVVCGITASGRTPYVQGALREAKSRGAKTIFITCNPGSPFNAEVDLPLPAGTGPEILSGSTRLKAGTATKLLLNTLTTGAMILSGKVYSNRMVDLSPGCSKLVDRGRRIVMDLLGVDEAKATQLVEESGGRVKVALLMGSAGIGRAEAEERLAAAGGFLRRTVPGGKLR
jgi:N-acetylmuramic acid 6-phosphate etherase